jgi:O-antigen ligase
MMTYNIYKTMSRGPWLGLILSLVLLFLFSPGSIRKSLMVIGLLTVATLIIRPGVRETLQNTYFETVDVNSARGGSYQYRYDLMSVGRHALARDFGRFLWGFGPESFSYLGLEGLDSTTGHNFVFESCDSAVVEIMVDTGYVGLLLVAGLLTTAAWFSLRRFSRLPKPANLLCLVFLSSIVAYGFMMVSVMNFGWGQQSYMLWIMLALSMVYPGLAQPKSLAKDLAVSPWQETSPQLAAVSQPRA